MKSLYWLRRDLRFLQNKTLSAFCESSSEAAFFYCFNSSANRAEGFRRQFLETALFEFNQELKKYDHSLFVSKQDLIQSLDLIYSQFKFESLYFSKEFSFEELNDEETVTAWCQGKNIKIVSYNTATLTEVDSWQDLGLPSYPQFTAFRKKIELSPLVCQQIPKPSRFPKPASLKASGYDFIKKDFHNTHPSESQGLERIDYYLFQSKKVLNYKNTRNGMIDFDDSTHFSPWLSLGLVSPETVYLELKKFEEQYEANESTYWVDFELLWRDYFKFLSMAAGNLLFLEKGLGNELSASTNGGTRGRFEAWCRGQTGQDFIDANMIEIQKTGWMSNRGRQNVASYLIHHLNVPWTWGAEYFEKTLIDYDPESNWGNWLYLSGHGTDPRSRVFNPEKQAQDYDPESLYRDKWLNTQS